MLEIVRKEKNLNLINSLLYMLFFIFIGGLKFSFFFKYIILLFCFMVRIKGRGWLDSAFIGIFDNKLGHLILIEID